MSVGSDWRSEAPRKAKICDFDDVLLQVNQDILRLEVPVQHTPGMCKSNSFQKLIEEELHMNISRFVSLAGVAGEKVQQLR